MQLNYEIFETFKSRIISTLPKLPLPRVFSSERYFAKITLPGRMHRCMFIQVGLIYKSHVANGTHDDFALIDFMSPHVT